MAPVLSAEEQEKQEKAARHWQKARRGIVGFVAKQEGARASLADIHSHSEMRYFIGHQKFSRMMEELLADGLLSYDAAEGLGTITEAGRALLAEEVPKRP